MKTRFYNLKNKFILITGSEGILGKELVNSFCEQESKLILIDIIKEPEEYKRNKNINYFKIDISNELEIKKLSNQISKITNTIDVLINNAATKTKSLENFFKSFNNYSIKTWREVMSVNLDGPFMICQMAEKFLKNSTNGASVIQLSSVYGVISPDNRIYKGSKFLNREITSPVAYGVSKSAIIGLSRYLSTYWAKLNIRVNSISPGGIESGQNIKFKKKYSKRVPMNRMALSREIVSVILFLSSEDSSYLNGQNIIVDGGLTVW